MQSIATTLGTCSMLAPMAASAQTSDKWEYGAIIYGWFPTIGGKTTFPAGTGTTIDVNADTILDNLKFTFMGSFEARKDQWGAFTDLIYLNVGGSKSQTRDVNIGGMPLPAGITADLNLDIKATIWTIAGEYRVATTPTASVDVLAGARSSTSRPSRSAGISAPTCRSTATPAAAATSDVDVSKWDANRRCQRPVRRVRRQAMVRALVRSTSEPARPISPGKSIGGVGYAFKWGEVIAVWRYMDYNFKSG